MFEKTGKYHRVPVGFGPAPSPRQDPKGERFDWSEAKTTTVGVVVEASVASIQALLPEGYEATASSNGKGTVLFEVMELRNLPWLAGRGYNTWGIYLNDVVCHRVSPPVKASYMSVLFESFTDPITTGREELGFCKLWAELPDGEVREKGRTHTASWLGFEFLRLELDGLKEHDPATAPGRKPESRIFTHPTKDGILHHRYVPSVGEPGKHDASYATFCPPPPGEAPVSYYAAPYASPDPCKPKEPTTFADGKGAKLEIKKGTFEQLPTLHNVVDGLAALQLGNVLEVAVQKFNGASDLKSNHRIEK